MPTINCRECHKEVSDAAQTCPHCGIKDPSPEVAKDTSLFQVMQISLAALAGIGIGVGAYSGSWTVFQLAVFGLLAVTVALAATRSQR